jgi:hypothetical protein
MLAGNGLNIRVSASSQISTTLWNIEDVHSRHIPTTIVNISSNLKWRCHLLTFESDIYTKDSYLQRQSYVKTTGKNLFLLKKKVVKS